MAGRTDLLFSEEAIEALSRLSRGIPRNINNIASSSLLEGFGTESQVISQEIVNDVAHELGLNGMK